MDYSQVVQEVRSGFLSGKLKDVQFRKDQLKALKRMVEDNEATFIQALKIDLNKPKTEAIAFEVEFIKNEVRHILANIDDWVKPEKVAVSVATFFDNPLIYHDSYGVVLIIGAWNFPLQLGILPLAGAIAAGNCAVIKPSELSPETAKAIADLLPKYLDQDCFKVVRGGIKETSELLKERFDKIFFTGSTTVGKIVREAANKYLTPVSLELGGKCPIYIDDTVNFDVAIRRMLWGKCINLGQTCIAPDYIITTKAVQEKIIEKVKEILFEWYGNDPQKSPDISRILNEKNFNRLLNYLNDGKVVVGGKYDAKDLFIEPTILTDVDPDSKVMTEEIFGPIFPIITVESAAEVIKFINKREKPLAFYVFSLNQKVVDLLIKEVPAGGMCINDVGLQLAVIGLPFGGVGASGMGAYHGKASYDSFTHRKSCLIRSYNPIADYVGSYRYPPYSEEKSNFLNRMLKERKIPSFRYFAYVTTFAAGAAAVLIAQNMI